jgi:hypothetical protein
VSPMREQSQKVTGYIIYLDKQKQPPYTSLRKEAIP